MPGNQKVWWIYQGYELEYFMEIKGTVSVDIKFKAQIEVRLHSSGWFVQGKKLEQQLLDMLD